MPPREKGFENVQRENWYPGSPKAATAIRRGSKYGDQYAKEMQKTSNEIMADDGDGLPSTPTSNKIARRGAASIAADKVVNDIEADERSKYAK